jgi:hypothetical protein
MQNNFGGFPMRKDLAFLRMAGVCLPLPLLTAVNLKSQEFRAVLTGQVTDSSGALIKDVNVKAVGTASDTTYTNKTCDKGVYYIPYVLPGSYTVSAEASGFAEWNRYHHRCCSTL